MLVIKKQVSLEFLGEEYKDAYLIFKAIPLDDYENIAEKTPEGTKQALTYIKEILEKYFIAGKFPDENRKLQDVTKQDLGQLDGESAIKCFEVLSGTSAGSQTDPLAVESSTPSKTEATPQSSS